MDKFVCCICIILLLLHISATAQDEEKLILDTDHIDTYISDISDIDTEFDVILDYIQDGDIKGAVSYVYHTSIIKIKSSLVDDNRIMYTIICICLFSVILRAVGGGQFTGAFEQILVCAVSAIMLNAYMSVFYLVNNIINNLAGFMNISLPVYFGISASVTSRLPFSVYGTFVAFVAMFQWGASVIALPSVSVVALCGIAENVCPSFTGVRIRKFIINMLHWLLGLYTTIFIGVLRISQIAAYGTDKLFMSGIRYTLSRSIPVVGGFISEAAGAVITSTLILHNSLGIGCVIIIAAIGILPFVFIFCMSGIIRLIASVMSPVACDGVCNVLTCFGECICELSVILLCACITFMIGIGIELSVMG